MRRDGRLAIVFAFHLALLVAGAARAQDTGAPAPCLAPPRGPCDPCDPRFDARRGPLEIRDSYLLAQPRLTLPATTPDTLGCGRTEAHLGFAWANSFGWSQDVEGETPTQRAYLVDGEAMTVDVTVLRGVTDDLDLGVRLPVHWRGGGVLDEVIDWYHGLTDPVILDNGRSEFDTNEFRVNGVLDDGTPFDADDDTGWGLGNVEGIARWRFLDGCRDGLSLALVGRLTLPTGTGPFDVGGVEVGGQVVAAHRLLRTVDVYAGVGGTWFSEDRHDGIGYEPWRAMGFVALEWRPFRRLSLFLETDAASRLIEDVARFPSVHWYLNAGLKYDLTSRTTLEVGFVENLEDQQSTADMGIVLGVAHRW